ncbi:MAG: dephospho-CoA kinase [Puniceicoccaceae bacterium]
MAGIRLGLTGTIGSGKSTALAFFSRLGWRIVRTDDLAREEMEAPDVVAAIRERWGGAVFHAGDGIDRRAVAGIVFGDPAELEWLESVLHPRVRERWTRALEQDRENDLVVEIPLLFEKNLASSFDFVVSLNCPEPLQVKRLMERGLSADDIEARKNRQLSGAEKDSRADFVLSNCGTLSFLEKQVIRLSRRLRGQKQPLS